VPLPEFSDVSCFCIVTFKWDGFSDIENATCSTLRRSVKMWRAWYSYLTQPKSHAETLAAHQSKCFQPRGVVGTPTFSDALLELFLLHPGFWSDSCRDTVRIFAVTTHCERVDHRPVSVLLACVCYANSNITPYILFYIVGQLTREWSDPTCRNLPWYIHIYIFFTVRVHTTKSTVKMFNFNFNFYIVLHCIYANCGMLLRFRSTEVVLQRQIKQEQVS
jgi:hypothetical protein